MVVHDDVGRQISVSPLDKWSVPLERAVFSPFNGSLFAKHVLVKKATLKQYIQIGAPHANHSALVQNAAVDLEASNTMLPKDRRERLRAHFLQETALFALLLIW